MTSSSFHLALGLGLGTAIALPAVIRAWRAGRPLASSLLRLMLVAWAAGLYAVFPALCAATDLIAGPPVGALWNLFLFYPLLDRVFTHTTLLGQAGVTGILTLHYLLILAAVVRTKK